MSELKYTLPSGDASITASSNGPLAEYECRYPATRRGVEDALQEALRLLLHKDEAKELLELLEWLGNQNSESPFKSTNGWKVRLTANDLYRAFQAPTLVEALRKAREELG